MTNWVTEGLWLRKQVLPAGGAGCYVRSQEWAAIAAENTCFLKER